MEFYSLLLQNKDDREAVALALYRAGYTVREQKRKDGSKSVVFPDYWKSLSQEVASNETA